MERNTKKTQINRFLTRPLSYSQLNTWEWSRDEWYETYIEGKKKSASPAMEFGTRVGDSIGTAESMVPGLVPPGVKEYELRASLGAIYIVGYCDHYCVKTKTLHENKTAERRDKWNQKSVDEHGQLTMYALMLFLRDKVKPEDITMQLNYIPVSIAGDFSYYLPDPVVYYPYVTHRTTQQVVEYAQYVTNTVKEMDQFIHKRALTA